MSEAKINGTINADGASMTLTIDDGVSGETSTVLGTEQITALIGILAAMRAKMAPGYTPQIAPGTATGATFDPAWYMNGEMIDGRRVLFTRHDGFGWLAWGFGQEQADVIAEWMTKRTPDLVGAPVGNA